MIAEAGLRDTQFLLLSCFLCWLKAAKWPARLGHAPDCLLMCKPGILLHFNSPLRRVTSVLSVTKASISVFPNCSLCGENPAVTASPVFNVWPPHCSRNPVVDFAELPSCWCWLILHHIKPRQPSRAQHFPCDSLLAQEDQAKGSKGCRHGPWAWCCLGWN